MENEEIMTKVRKARNEYMKCYRSRRKEQLKEYNKNWREKNKDKIKQYNINYWAKKVSNFD